MAEPPTCADVRERAADLLLADLDGSERAEIVAHLAGCPQCRAEVATLSSTLDAMSGVVEPVEPSPDFTERVVAGLGDDRSTTVAGLGKGPGSTVADDLAQARQRRRRSRLAALSSAAVVAAAIGVGVGFATSGGSPAAHPRPVAVADLRTTQGGEVGQAVVVGTTGAQISVGFDVSSDDGVRSYDGRYAVLAVLHDGQRVPLGTVLVSNGRGGLEARTTLASAQITTIKVQSPAGRDLCAGLVPHPAGG